MTIKKIGSGYEVVSKTGKNLGKEKTKSEAEKRLAEVEMFKKLSGWDKKKGKK